MTHDCDRATEWDCYRAGYLRGQQADVVEWETFGRSLEARAPRYSVYASLVLAGKLVAGLAGLEALEFASGFVFAGLAGFACTGWSMRAWRWLKGGANAT